MDVLKLKEKSRWLRNEVFEMVVRSKKGHYPSSSSITELVVALYYGGYFRYDAKKPRWEERDRLFISKGHAGMVLYPILADLGFVPQEEVAKFTKAGGVFRFYPDPSIPGIEAITGSLGHGLGIGAGHALTGKRDGKDFKTYVILGDGECYEGSVWETALFAAHHELENLVAIVDRNGCCILDHTENCVKLDPIADKWQAFGWETHVINGHSLREIGRVLDRVKEKRNGKPIAIVADTVKGKGVSYMENKANWHNKMPTEDQITQARKELEALSTVD